MKKILVLVLAAIMVASLCVTTSAAEVPSDGLLHHFKLDGNLKDEVTGTSPDKLYTSGGKFAEDDRTESDLQYYTNGVNGGQSLAGQMNNAGFAVPGVESTDFSIGIWICAVYANPGYTPIVWYGSQNQTPENWIGIWNADTTQNPWGQPVGPCLGSNDSSGHRYGVVPETNLYIDKPENDILLPWTHVVITCKIGEDGLYTGTLYHNGVNVGSVEGLPNPNTSGDAQIYFNSINAWEDKAVDGYLDDIVVYGKALTDEEVKALYDSYEAAPEFEDADAMDATLVKTESDETEAPADDATEAPADETEKAPAETAGSSNGGSGTEAATEKTDSKDEGGCGSTLGAAAALIAVTSVFGCALIKKH